MVLAYHLIWTAYGWWLPNDPRGSMSQFIASDVIAQLGELHYGRKRVQPFSREIRAFYEEAQEILKFPLLRFTEREMNAIADAFARVIDRERYTCYACAIMDDHDHLVIRKHRDTAEQMIAKLQEESRDAIIAVGDRHFDHPVWGGCGYKVFLDSTEDIWRTIPYVEQNPTQLGLPKQVFPFVKPYDNFPFHKRSRGK